MIKKKKKKRESSNYLSRMYLTHIKSMLCSYGNQAIDLHCRSIDWVLYERNIELIWVSMLVEVSFQLYFERYNKLDYEQIFL